MGPKMGMQRFRDGTGSDGVKGSFHWGFSFGFGGTFYGSRLSALILQRIFRIACYLLPSEAIACAHHCSRDKGDIIVKQSGTQKAVEPVPSRTHGHRIA